MLTEILMEVKQMSRDIQFIKTEIAKSAMNIPGAGSQREEPFPIVLPLANEEQFDEAEAALKEESVRRKMITRLALVGGTNAENMIRRMLSATMANSVACIFNWAGKGPKRAFKDTLMQDCMFAAARQFDRKLTELQYRGALQKWLRYAPERSGGADTSNTDLTTLVESLAEKEHTIQRLKEQRFQDDQEKGEELVASRTTLERMKELEENRQVAQQLSFNVGPQPQPIETRQDRRGTAPPARAAQPRRRVRDVERRDRIRQFQEGEEREHLIRQRNWLEVEKRRLDADCMELQFLERERQRILFERPAQRCPSLHQRVEECGNPSMAQRPWRPRGQVVEAVYHRFSSDGASKSIGANH
ncbi:unnamed protein product [Boreogadus saida]